MKALLSLLAVLAVAGAVTPVQAAVDGRASSVAATVASDCERPSEVVRIVFSKASYPHITKHIKKSWRLGYRKVLRINRPGADERRDKALAGIPTKDGFDRDEAPAAVLRKRWRADVAYVPSSENRSAGASLGNQISPYCNGVRVKYRFIP